MAKEPDKIQPSPEQVNQFNDNLNKLRGLLREMGPDASPDDLLVRWKRETGLTAREIRRPRLQP